MSRSRFLELGQPVPSLPGISTNFTEESFHVPVNQIPVGLCVSSTCGEIPQVLLLGQRRGVSFGTGRVAARHAVLLAQHFPLKLAGAPRQQRRGRTRQVLSCYFHGPASMRTPVHFRHVDSRKGSESLTVAVNGGSWAAPEAQPNFTHRAAESTLLRLHQTPTRGGVAGMLSTDIYPLWVMKGSLSQSSAGSLAIPYSLWARCPYLHILYCVAIYQP